jgi:hypothetical protein
MRFVAALSIILLAGCAGPMRSSSQPSTTPSEPVLGTPQVQASPAASEQAEEASDLLECDGPRSDMGGFANDFGVDSGGATPDEAFEAWIAASPFPLPRTGYSQLGSVGDRWVYTFESDGHTKVVVVISPRFGGEFGLAFAIDEMRTCDPSEYGAAVDLGPGRRAWVHAETGHLLTDIEGPGHCDWQSARMLHLTDGQGALTKHYVRDPEGVFGGHPGLLYDYADGVELPADAIDSGYRTQDELELWFTDADTAAYVVTPEGVERWPRADPPIGCA